MNNFHSYLTPEEYFNLNPSIAVKGETDLKSLRKKANSPRKVCFVCEMEDAWKLADTGMCFSCTTGESDASNDYELIPSRETINGK